jgi:hypothetical protein
MRSTIHIVILAAAAGGLTPLVARADGYDLTTPGSQAAVSGALFQTADFQPAGTGYIQSFVRIQGAGVERGYNTSARPLAFDENSSPNFTRDVQLKDLGVTVVGGIVYANFGLDINQTSSSGRYLSLDDVKIYVSSAGQKTGSDLAALGSKVFDLDTSSDNWIRLDATNSHGSGQGDMTMLVPLALFTGAGATPDSFITLYSQFGVHDAANSGFEEWTTRGPGAPVVPAPATGLLALAGATVGLSRRRR